VAGGSGAQQQAAGRTRRPGAGIDLQAYPRVSEMKLAGFLLLLSGWGIVLAALTMLAQAQVTARTGFVLAGVSVEALGLVLVVRCHLLRRGHRG